ncbi:MAG TPA: hypothetical protein DD490_33460 [Acidobacteria bacterium]|nr:hypothetical protein [Acidobacteriota bacterium]
MVRPTGAIILDVSKLRLSLLLLLGVLSAPPPLAAVETSPYGINIHAPQGEELSLLLDRVREAGIGWVRIDFVWAWVEPSRDEHDWGVYDAITAAAQARGIEIYATLAYTPAWATAGAELTGVPDAGQWAELCGAAATRYRGAIRHWGIWNEPNLDKFWAGSRQQYVDVLLKPCADAIHAADPAARVGGPELAHVTSGDADWYAWLRDILRSGGDRLDFVSHHVYDGDGHRDVGDRLDGSTVFGDQPSLWDVVNPSVKEVLKNAGWWGKPVWLTETGWDAAAGESRQASFYSGLLNDWLTGAPNRSWIEKIFFYELIDSPPPVPSWGILRQDHSTRPSFEAYRLFIAGHTEQVDGAAPVASTFPDTIEAGLPLEVRLTFRNTGTTTWTEEDQIRLGAGEDHDPFTEPRQFLAPGERIAPNQEKTFVLPLATPQVPGTYRVRWQMLREGTDRFGTAFEKDVRVVAGPSVAQRTLSLMNGRFRAVVSWRDPGSRRAGFGRAVPGPDPTGFFWFFNAANLELVVKALDGRPLNGHYWLFYGALSDVEYQLDVTEPATGRTKRYHNEPGSLCGRGDTSAFPAASAAFDLPAPAAFSFAPPADPAAAAAVCVPDARTLCLLGGRFRASVTWRTRAGASGDGMAVPMPGGDSGTFWFFDGANVELVVKALDGRAFNNRYWFFYGALSDVQYTITVTDLVTGARKRYTNPFGNLCGRGDTNAFVP